MADQSVPGLGDLFALLGASNPFAPIMKSFDQFRRGVDGFLTSVENFNQTMETLNSVAARVSALLDDVEEPIRAMMPQVTRSIKASEAMISQMSGPIEALAELARRLQPLTQLAENAGGLFGLRPLQALRAGGGRPPVAEPPPPPPPPAKQPVAKTPAKKAAATKAVAKKAPTKKRS